MFSSRTLLRLPLMPLVMIFIVASHALAAEKDPAAEKDFSDNYSQVFQIQVVAPDAGSKSSIGSGFQVTSDGLIMTNFHVIASFVESPDNFEIKFSDKDGQTGPLELVNFDVINDLALLKHPTPTSSFFNFSKTPSIKGETLYALGNPADWGMVMVPGPNNGFTEHSYREQILFSGSLNGGMSGGPSLNSDGDVVGVNVASAGSQLSFLIPARHAVALKDSDKILDTADYKSEIASQIRDWQDRRLGDLVNSDWDKEKFVGRQLVGEMRNDFRCWGKSNEDDEERKFSRIYRYCYTSDDIFITDNLDVGSINFWFSEAQSISLNQFQFANSQERSLSSNSNSAFEHSTNFRCKTRFLDQQKEENSNYIKVTTCVRAYKELGGLYDSVLILQNHESLTSFAASLSVSGAEQHQIQSLNKRFIEAAL